MIAADRQAVVVVIGMAECMVADHWKPSSGHRPRNVTIHAYTLSHPTHVPSDTRASDTVAVI